MRKPSLFPLARYSSVSRSSPSPSAKWNGFKGAKNGLWNFESSSCQLQHIVWRISLFFRTLFIAAKDLKFLTMYRAIKTSWNRWPTGIPARFLLPCLPRSTCSSSTTFREIDPNGEQKRFNPLEIQMLSSSLHAQVFRGKMDTYDPTTIKKCQEHLTAHSLWKKSGTVLPEVEFELPPQLGSNIDEHFRNIAEQQSRPYFEKARLLAELRLPAIPNEWCFSPGWTKYVYDDKDLVTSSVDVPDEDALIFDVEVSVNEGPFPVIAVAASPTAW